MVPRTKVFVGSLPPGVKPEELRRLFESYGVVTECDIMNRCGFVHMQTEDMAENAIQALNNTQFKGVNICVERGRLKDRRNNNGVNGGGGGGSRGRDNNRGRRNFNGGMNDRNSSGNNNFDRRNNSRGGGGGGISGGPMRRDRGGAKSRGNRSAPYGNRDNGGMMRNMGNFDRNTDMNHRTSGNGGSMNMMGNRGPPMDRMGGLGMGGGLGHMNNRYNNDNFGFSNEDRRGFALPEKQMYPNDMRINPPMYDNMRGGSMGGNLGRPPPMGPPSGSMGDMFSRRPQMSGGMGGGGRHDGGFGRLGGDYNKAFPPLGGGGGGGASRGGMNNRNGPRREMMNRRM